MAIGELVRRVGNVEDELEPLRPVPFAVAANRDRLDAVDRRLDRMREDARDAAKEEVRRVDALHSRLDRQDAKMAEGFRSMGDEIKAVATGTQVAARNGARQGVRAIPWGSIWMVFIGVAGGIGVPIGIAWALTGGGP